MYIPLSLLLILVFVLAPLPGRVFFNWASLTRQSSNLRVCKYYTADDALYLTQSGRIPYLLCWRRRWCCCCCVLDLHSGSGSDYVGATGWTRGHGMQKRCCSLRLTGLNLSSTLFGATPCRLRKNLFCFIIWFQNKLQMDIVVNISLFFYVVDQALNVDFVCDLFDMGYSILLRTFLCGSNVYLFWTERILLNHLLSVAMPEMCKHDSSAS